MNNTKSRFSHQDGASFLLYEKIKTQPRRSYEHMPLIEFVGNKAALAREYFLLGNEYFKKNEYKVSIGYFQFSLKYSYQSPQIHNNLGVLHALISEEQISLEYFKKSIQLRPKQIFAYINLANMQIKRGEYASGIELYLDLLTQYKQERIIDNFNKILRNYNNFYKYTKKYIRCAHRDIESFMLQDILKLVIEHVSKDAPISLQLLLSSENLDELANIKKVKSTFEAIKIMYSEIHWSLYVSQFNKSIMYGKILSQSLVNLDSKTLNLVVCLLMSYFFTEKEESSLSCYFNSLIDEGNPQIKHLKCYQQLFKNYQYLKKIKLMPYLIQSQTQIIVLDPERQKRGVVNTIEKLFFHKKFHMYQLEQLFKDQNKIHNLNDKETEILANTLLDCRSLKASKFLFQKYRKCAQPHFLDYLFQDNILQFCNTIYMQDRKKDFNFQLFNSQLDKQLYSGQCPIIRQIEIFSYKILSFFEKEDYQTAIELCEEGLEVYPKKKDKFYQYLGAIYLHKYSINLQKEWLIKSLSMLEQSILFNPKNDEAHFIQYCLLYQQRRTTAVQYLYRALQINPQKLKYMIQLGLVYQNSPNFRDQINKFVTKLDEQYTKATDFKVKANIAIYQLYTEKYDQSYAFFKKSMLEASKEDDTNCEDLLFIYFVNKLFWIYYHIAEKQHSFRFQLIFYLIIFIKSPFLFEKYEQKTHLCDQDIYKQIERDLAEHIQLDSTLLIQKIRHLDTDHKNLIYPYIFKQVFKHVVNFNSVVFYAQLKYLQPSLMENVWTYEVVANLKQQKILKIKQFITYVSKSHQRDVVTYCKQSNNISQQIRRSTFYKISQFGEKKQEIINELNQFKKRIKHLICYNDTQIYRQIKLNCQYGKTLLKKTHNIASAKQQILQLLKELEVICLIFQYFYCFLEENPTLKSFINKLCQKLLQNRNLDEMFFKLRNYIVEDYISSNSNISLISSSNYNQQAQIKFFDNTKIDFSDNPVLHSQKIEFIEENNALRDCLPFYKLSLPQWKEIEILLFAVKLILQFEKQGFILQELSIADFKIENSQILFYGIKKTFKGQSKDHHLNSLQQFFKEIQKKCQDQTIKKIRFYIKLLFNKKIIYHTFIIKVTSICRQIKERQPESRQL